MAVNSARPDRVWYLAYGSNISRKRFLRYLEGDDDHRGARDPSHPIDDRFAVAPLRLRFAGMSHRWGGGVCFVDPDTESSAYIRAWNITAEQFEDVFAQENKRPIGEPFPWSEVLTGSAIVGDGWYRSVLSLDIPCASPRHPAMTFTWEERQELRAPSASYRDTVAEGLSDHPTLTAAEIDEYLDAATV